MAAGLSFTARLPKVALLILAFYAPSRAEICQITTEQQGDYAVIKKECETLVVEITCSLNLPVPVCTNQTYTKTATTTSSSAIRTSLTATSTLTSTVSTTTRTLTSTSVTASSSTTASVTSTTATESTTSVTQSQTATFSTFTATSTTMTMVPESTSGNASNESMVVITGWLGFPRQNITQDDAEMAVVSTLADYLGLPQSVFTASAEARASASTRRLSARRSQSLPRRLSDIWHVDFTVLVDEVDEPWVRQRLEELASSTAGYDALLREELVSLGSAPSEDFVVTAAIAPAEGEGTGGSDDLPIVFIIAAGAAIFCLLGLMIWKGCSRPQPAEEPPYSKTDLPQDDNEVLPPPRLATVVEVPSTIPTTSNGMASPISSLEVMTGSVRDLPLYTRTNTATEAEGHTEEAQAAQAEPPLPPPEEPPPEELPPPSTQVEMPISEVQLSDIQPEVQLADVQPEVLVKPPRQRSTASDWILADVDLSARRCQSLSPSSWSGSWTWTQLSRFHRHFDPPTSKDYSLTFQRGGRLVGQGSDSLSSYKLTAGSYRETGELTWREVPQSASGLAFECSGHLRSRRRKDMQPEDSFEIVGVFAAYDTSVSALQVGSGRFSIRTQTGLEPTAIGHPASYFAADRV